ncbi:MAG: hypothetical protein IKL79_00510 [Clostridia bacterium]|nr:hypothetical protein [Clostridia bacterium]
MEKEKPNFKDPQTLISLIIVCIVFAGILVGLLSHIFVAQRLKLNIYVKSTLAYDSFGVAKSIKSISISSDPTVGLGYCNDDRELCFCIYGVDEGERSYVKYTASGAFSGSHKLKIKSEIVCKRSELKKGGTVSGFSKIYVDGLSSRSGYYEFSIRISEVNSGAPRLNIKTTYKSTTGYLTNYTDESIEIMISAHFYDLFNAFQDYIRANDLSNIYRG